MKQPLHTDAIAPRDPETVMKLARMGAFHACRLSSMRVLLRRLKSEGWTFERRHFEIDAKADGYAVYTAHGPDHSYSLVAFSNNLPPEKRSDRVIATEWDATFTLLDGVPDAAEIAFLSRNIPRQEAGRVTGKSLSVSRANRSVRLFDYVVEQLAAGQQPDEQRVGDVGYLMRTTAVYGSGKLGAADREATSGRPEFKGPFQIEMLSVYLTRAFVMDLVEHLAKLRAPDTAVALQPSLRRRFGIGNSTGLGMAPFLINHPVLLNNWVGAREHALARVRNIAQGDAETFAEFNTLLARARVNAANWRSEHPLQIEKLQQLRTDLAQLQTHLAANPLGGQHPWNHLWVWAEQALGLEGQEQLASLMIEPHGALVDDLADTMHADEAGAFMIDGAMPVATLTSVLQDVYGWALDTDWEDEKARARVWYTSQEKLEPRLAERFDEPVEAYEQPLCPGRDAARLFSDLRAYGTGTVAAFLRDHPEHRHIVRRAQIGARYPYSEIRDNMISAQMLPIDLLRAKLSFFGAGHFDPRSDRWVRINMYKDAPFPDELARMDADDWTFSPLKEAGQ